MEDEQILAEAPKWAVVAFNQGPIEDHSINNFRDLLKLTKPRSIADIQTIVDLRRENAELEAELRNLNNSHIFKCGRIAELEKERDIRDLEQQAKALNAVCDYAVQINMPNSEWVEHVAVRQIQSVSMDLNNKAKALRGE